MIKVRFVEISTHGEVIVFSHASIILVFLRLKHTVLYAGNLWFTYAYFLCIP